MKKLILALSFLVAIQGHAFTLNFDNTDFVVSPSFSNVGFFGFAIEIDAPLASGLYENPDIIAVEYSVSGSLVPGTPSGFSAFNLQRVISGVDFYAQGSSIRFEIANDADLSDGLQIDELVGEDLVFVFNGREEGNGRFHPALFELNSDGTGRIQNSNNIPDLEAQEVVDFGAEYITDLSFDPGNLNLLQTESSSGGGSLTMLWVATLMGLVLIRRTRRL